MRAPSYQQKRDAAIAQAERVEKSIGKPDPRFNKYIKDRKHTVKELSHAGKYIHDEEYVSKVR